MSSYFPAFNLSHGATSSMAALQQRTQLAWKRLHDAVRSPAWPGILGTLVILAMLLAFHQVVLGAVQRGALRHKATAMHAEASWRCNALQGQSASELCLLQLNSAANDAPLARGQATLLARLH